MPSRKRWLYTAGLWATAVTGVAHAQEQTPAPAPAGKVYFQAGAEPTTVPVPQVPALASGPATAPQGPACAAPAAVAPPGPGSSCKEKHRYTQYLCRRNLVGFLPEFNEPALGTFLYAHGRTMVANGEAARMTLYHYDFDCDGEQLTPRGRYQLKKIAELLRVNHAPVVIECSRCKPELAEARRMVVLFELGQISPIPVPPERVVVGRSMAIGMRGVEAELVFRNMLLQTQRQGIGLGGAGAGAGAGAAGAAAGGAAGIGRGAGGP